MSFAELLRRLSGPGCLTVVVSRRAMLGAGLAFAVLAVWAAVTGSYFLFQDDVAAHLIARQSAMQQAYEERIGALRVHLDRLASQNLLDQNGLDRRVSELMARQAQLESRQAIMAALSDRSPAGSDLGSVQETGAIGTTASPAAPTWTLPVPERPKPTPVPDTFGLRLRGSEANAPPGAPQRASEHNPLQALRDRIAHLQQSLVALETTQIQGLEYLARAAEARASQFRDVLREAGLNPDTLDGSARTSGMGGPLVALGMGPGGSLFETMADRARSSIERLEQLDRTAGALPFGRPTADVDLTSAFGYRIDPFTRGPAMHTGLDFRAEAGTPIQASGAGQVVAAEYAGGYGNMVEIDHGNGVTTRYAHLSSLAVFPGQTVAAGALIGRAGSTGRSTGAHLHYETRIDGEAVDPQRFLRAGSRLTRR